MKCIWRETEHVMILKRAQHTAQTPQIQGGSDFFIMEFAMSKQSFNKINRYRLHLQAITFFNLLTYDGNPVHPNTCRTTTT
jgi:hypothetical protein